MKKQLLAILILFLGISCFAQNIVASSSSFDLKDAAIYVDSNEVALIKKSVFLLQQDIEKVTGCKLPIIHSLNKPYKHIVAIGSVQHSAILKELVNKNKLNISAIDGKWEAYQIKNIQNPFGHVQDILTIAGSDRRGTAFGIFELSKQIGVSPWYWWADVPPVTKKENLYINQAVSIVDSPAVKYRGIFINDEAPALSNWSKQTFGGFNHLFYEKVFELMLRLKSNYLWPAMWGNAFYDDDTLNIKTADDYGIVIGTSHHEPLMRAHHEWRRYGKGKWNYDSNAYNLQAFWKQGMQRATNEKIVSVGMRGDGDEPMSSETATALLEKIVTDQRKIIEQATNKPASQTPQLWALYKEVQDYYDKGMRVPDDITLLLCDDNWGNIRRLPKLDERPRAGGYGIYYHFDYVGGPRNYKWVNTNHIARIWEQMHLAWEYKVKQIWIVNVGDIKPMELPTSFFLDYAWNPSKYTGDNFSNYHQQWAAQQFGNKYAKEIAQLLNKYTQYNARRKPELLDDKTYGIDGYYKEFNMAVSDYKDLFKKAENIYQQLPIEKRNAFYQLVLHPIKACSNLHEMYYCIAMNKSLFNDAPKAANSFADKAKELFINDSLITKEYHQLNNGKWNHMMDQIHIGYTNWQQPSFQKMPEVKYNYDTAENEIAVPPYSIYDPLSTEAEKPKAAKKNSFYEEDGHVSIYPDHYTNAITAANIKWQTIKDIGRDGNGVTAFPVTHVPQHITTNSPHLEYEVYTYSKDNLQLHLYFSTTLNFLHSTTGLQFAVSIDNEKPQVISLNKEDNNVRIWNTWVANNIIIKTTNHTLSKAGKHTIKYWLIDAGIVLQKLVLTSDSVDKTYLGPAETIYKP